MNLRQLFISLRPVWYGHLPPPPHTHTHCKHKFYLYLVTGGSAELETMPLNTSWSNISRDDNECSGLFLPLCLKMECCKYESMKKIAEERRNGDVVIKNLSASFRVECLITTSPFILLLVYLLHVYSIKLGSCRFWSYRWTRHILSLKFLLLVRFQRQIFSCHCLCTFDNIKHLWPLLFFYSLMY